MTEQDNTTDEPANAENVVQDPSMLRLERLIALLEASSLNELEFEDGTISVRLSRGAPLAGGTTQAVVSAAAGASIQAPSSAEAEAPEETGVVIRSPFVGTFYRSPSPEAAPFVDVGQRVQKGQTLCIVEAMKLMNEIEAETSGTVRSATAENGSAVQFDDILFVIDPD